MKKQHRCRAFDALLKASIFFFVFLLVVGFSPDQLFAQADPPPPKSGDVEKFEVIEVEHLHLGKKWLFSGIGDEKEGDDEWLRLLNHDGRDYYGGFAAGKLWSKTGSVQRSDVRAKQDIVSLENSLQKLQALRGVSFRWKEAPEDQHLGLIAQEVEKVFPEVVMIGPDGTKGVNYASLVAPLVNAIQEQQHIIDTQNARLVALEDRLTAIEQQTGEAHVSVSNWLITGMMVLGGVGLVVVQRRRREGQ